MPSFIVPHTSARGSVCEPHGVAVSPDGRLVAYGGGVRYATPKYRKLTTHVVVVDSRSGSMQSVCSGHGDLVRAIAFTAQGDALVSADETQGVLSFDAMSGRKVTGRKCPELEVKHWLGEAQHEATRAVAAASTGRVVAAGGVTLVVFAGGARLKKQATVLLDGATQGGPGGAVQDRTQAFALSPDGDSAFVGGAKATLSRIDLASSQAVTHTRQAMVCGLAATADGQRLLSLEAFGEDPHLPNPGARDVLLSWASPRYKKRLCMLDAATLAEIWSRDLDGNPQRIVVRDREAITAGTEGDRVVVRRHRLEGGAESAAMAHETALSPQQEMYGREPFFWVRSLATGGDLAAAATPDGVRLFAL